MLIALSLKHARSPFGVREFGLELPALRAGVFQSDLGGVDVVRQATHSDCARGKSAGCTPPLRPHYSHALHTYMVLGELPNVTIVIVRSPFRRCAPDFIGRLKVQRVKMGRINAALLLARPVSSTTTEATNKRITTLRSRGTGVGGSAS